MALSAEVSRGSPSGNSWLALSAFCEYQKDEGLTDIRVPNPSRNSPVLRNTQQTRMLYSRGFPYQRPICWRFPLKQLWSTEHGKLV